MGERKGFYPSIPIAQYAGTRYTPSNGIEGECFHDAWCCYCARDRVMNGTVSQDDARDGDFCETLGESFRSEGTEAWVFGDDGFPKCTRFEKFGEPIPQRDDKTIDMFGGDRPQGDGTSGEGDHA